MEFQFMVSAAAERSEGKFASRDELSDQIAEALEGADPGSLDGENGGVYDITEWLVEPFSAKDVTPKQKKAPDTSFRTLPEIKALLRAWDLGKPIDKEIGDLKVLIGSK